MKSQVGKSPLKMLHLSHTSCRHDVHMQQPQAAVHVPADCRHSLRSSPPSRASAIITIATPRNGHMSHRHARRQWRSPTARSEQQFEVHRHQLATLFVSHDRAARAGETAFWPLMMTACSHRVRHRRRLPPTCSSSRRAAYWQWNSNSAARQAAVNFSPSVNSHMPAGQKKRT